MPLTSGTSLNLTMKQGTTISTDTLTSWVDQIASRELTVASGASAPATGVRSLNGTPVATFNGTDTVLQLVDGTYDRDAGNAATVNVFHYVIRIPSGVSSGYIEDAENGVNRSAIVHSSSDIGFQSTTNNEFTGRPSDEWFVVSYYTNDSTNNLKIWINDTKTLDMTTSFAPAVGGNGITLGARYDSINHGEFSVAQIVQYMNQDLTETEIENNIAFLQQEWALATSPPNLSDSSLTATNISTNSFDVAFTKATDDTTDQTSLEYSLYISASGDDLSTTTAINANGTLADTGTDVTQLSATGLSPSNEYSYNVVVEDADGSKTVYTQGTQQTLFNVAGIVQLDGEPQEDAYIAIFTASIEGTTLSSMDLVEITVTDANGYYEMSTPYNSAEHYFTTVLNLNQIDSGTVDSATVNTITDSALNLTASEYVDGSYVISTTGGTGANQLRVIEDNTAQTISVVTDWDVTPDDTTTYVTGRLYSDDSNFHPSSS